jgi:DNA processing protein
MRAARCQNPWLVRDKAELVAICCLPGITTGRIAQMVTLYGSAADAWRAVRTGAADCGGGAARDWREVAAKAGPAAIAGELATRGIEAVVRGEEGYPPLLAATYDPPFTLFYKGVLPGTVPCVALVGSRKATAYGLEVARWLAGALCGAGVSVVSGAAEGVDSAAHRGAIEAGGHTCAVLGCGADVVYPRANGKLFESIEAQGCIISEYPPGTGPRTFHFPARNRLIAGMSLATVVVEASERSGALITCGFALAEDREVLAVPGQVFSRNSKGTNALIRAGAALVTDPDDILAEIGLARRTCSPSTLDTGALSGDEEALMGALQGGPCDIEDLSRRAGMSAAGAVAVVSCLEVRGLVRREAGGRYQGITH